MKTIIILSLVVLTLIFCYFQGYLDFLYYFFQYPVRVMNIVAQKIANFFQVIAFINKLHQENVILFEQNQKLLGLNIRLKEVEKENDFLRQQLNLKSQQDFKFVLGSVISSGQSFFIDQKIENKPVILPGGILVGQTENNGRVKLITDPRSKINALIQETRSQGIVRGDYGLGLIMDLPITETALEKGQIVITSSRNKEFPSGLLIGQIIDISKNNNQGSQIIRIKPFFNPKNLEKVFVITSY